MYSFVITRGFIVTILKQAKGLTAIKLLSFCVIIPFVLLLPLRSISYSPAYSSHRQLHRDHQRPLSSSCFVIFNGKSLSSSSNPNFRAIPRLNALTLSRLIVNAPSFLLRKLVASSLLGGSLFWSAI
uniref:Uncharacterized protein n=1 Tax=Solanum lycopersicum TaxID=4081 RepID=A0A3Q7FQR0_SOLLC